MDIAKPHFYMIRGGRWAGITWQGMPQEKPVSAKRVRHLRVEHDLTQKQLAAMLKVEQGTISKWEATGPSFSGVKKLCALFHIDPNSLLLDEAPIAVGKLSPPASDRKRGHHP
jgi:transcriptional regulator with XRE-family HTH domain